jgi:hypothetical protein
MEIIQTTNNLERLEELEEWAVEAAANIIKSTNELCIYVYEILENGLFLNHLDENGLPLYTNQSEYLSHHLLDLLGISKATLFNYYQVSRLALGDFNLSREKFVEQGGYNTWRAIAKNVNLDRKGKLISLKRNDIPDSEAKEYILKQLEDVVIQQDRENLTQGQTTKLLADALNKTNQITFRLIERDDLYRTMWEYVDEAGTLQSGFIDNLSTPSIVLETYCRKLGIQI